MGVASSLENASDPGSGIIRLEALITTDLHDHVDGSSRSAQVGWGVFFTVLHQVAAILHLHRNECCFAAAPNRRTAIEYAIFLVWLADRGDEAVDVLNRALKNDQGQLANRLREAGAKDRFSADDYQVLVDTVATDLAPSRDERLMKPGHLMDAYGYTDLKVYYQVESRFSHVSLTAVQAFARQEEDGIHLTQRPMYTDELIPCQRFCLMVLFDAMLAFNQLLVDRPWTKDLTQIAREYDFPINLPERNAET